MDEFNCVPLLLREVREVSEAVECLPPGLAAAWPRGRLWQRCNPPVAEVRDTA
jgi:hypothetical protein